MSMFRCSCCGSDFATDAPQDPNQDVGYGSCPRCEEWIERCFTRPAEDKAITLLRDALSETNRARFDAMDRDLQLWVVSQAVEDKVITWVITR